eukprot:12936611-Prorocentrum_lima.AAC.1
MMRKAEVKESQASRGSRLVPPIGSPSASSTPHSRLGVRNVSTCTAAAASWMRDKQIPPAASCAWQRLWRSPVLGGRNAGSLHAHAVHT